MPLSSESTSKNSLRGLRSCLIFPKTILGDDSEMDTPSQKVKRLVNSKNKRTHERLSIHFQRISAELTISSNEAPAAKTPVRILLNDFSEKGVGLYSPFQIQTTDGVILELFYPYPMKLRAKVVWCQEFNVGSHILTQNAFPYRVGLEFISETEEDKKSIRDLCDAVFKTIQTFSNSGSN